MPTLAFTRLRELVEEGAGSSLTERQVFWKQAPEKEASKRKGAPSREGQGTGHMQGRAGAGGDGGSAFKSHMLERRTPPAVCDFSWRGDVSRRVTCLFSHFLGAGRAPSVTVQQQQQQQQQLQAPPPPPPPTPRHQPPQYQAIATVGDRAEGGGAGAFRPPSVPRFSRNYAPGGRSGASAGGEAGRGTGSN